MAIETRTPFETDEGPCIICRKGVDDCICPECPTCGSQGDPNCYREPGHPLRLTMPQVIASKEGKIAAMKERFADTLATHEAHLAHLRQQKEVDMGDYSDVLPPRQKKRR